MTRATFKSFQESTKEEWANIMVCLQETQSHVATRVIVLAQGEIVADGPAPDVVIGSPMFAPQVSKVLSPQPWLTVAQVARALEPAS